MSEVWHITYIDGKSETHRGFLNIGDFFITLFNEADKAYAWIPWHRIKEVQKTG